MVESNSKNLFITGGTGFFGKAILTELQNSGMVNDFNKITILSRNPDEFLKKFSIFSAIENLSFIQGDLLTFTSHDFNYSHIIHAATDTDNVSLNNKLKYFDEIFIGTRRVLDFAVNCGADRFLYISSGAVYGVQPDDIGTIPESYLGAPATCDSKSIYGQAKRSAEQLCQIYNTQYGIECIIARCFTFIGENMPLNGQYAIGNFMRDALSNSTNQIVVNGDGSPIRSYMYTKDLARWLLKMLYEGESCHPYNVGSDQPISIGELARLVQRLLAPNKEVLVMDSNAKNNGRSKYVPSINRARTELDLSIEYQLADAILKVAKTMKYMCS